MRKALLLMSCAVAVSLCPVHAEDSAMTPPHKVLVWVQGSDEKISEQLEYQILEELADRQIAGDRFAKLFPPGEKQSNTKKIQAMKDGGYDALLYLQRSSAVHFDNAMSTGTTSSATPLRAFLRKSAPGGETFEVVQDSATTKTIQVNNAYGTWDVVKGRAVLFDINQQTMGWTERTQIKTPTGLSTDRYLKSIAKSLVDDLASAHLVPPGKK